MLEKENIATRKGFAQLEQQHIMPIPEDERTGTNRSNMSIWVSLNMMPLAVVAGAIASGTYGLPISWSIVAILVGNVIGAFGAALHASQGPQLGIPQMLQARAQFGYFGGSLFALIALIMFLGFFAGILIVAKDSIQLIFPEVNGSTAIVVFSIVGILLCVFGYNLLRKTMAWISIIIGITVAVSMVALWMNPDVVSKRAEAVFNFDGFFAMLAIGVVWQLAYAPYVSDYTRYLPKNTGPKVAFWSTYIGLVGSSVFVMSLGVLLGAASPDNPLAALSEYLGHFGIFVLLIFAITSALINGVELYSAVMNALTTIQSTFKGVVITTTTRILTTIFCGIVGMSLALFGQGSFMVTFDSFLTILLYVLIPWSAINLVDYFIIKKGIYEINDLFSRDGGRYGKWNTIGLLSYFIGLVAQVPFMVTDLYTGPMAAPLNGIDVAWLIGFFVTAIVFLILMRFFPEKVSV